MRSFVFLSSAVLVAATCMTAPMAGAAEVSQPVVMADQADIVAGAPVEMHRRSYRSSHRAANRRAVRRHASTPRVIHHEQPVQASGHTYVHRTWYFGPRGYWPGGFIDFPVHHPTAYSSYGLAPYGEARRPGDRCEHFLRVGSYGEQIWSTRCCGTVTRHASNGRHYHQRVCTRYN